MQEDQSPLSSHWIEHWTSLDKRLGTVERDITELSASYRSQTNDLSDLKSAVQRLTDIVSQRSQTNWSVLVAFAGVLFTAIFFYTGLVTDPIRNMSQHNAQRVEQVRDDMAERIEDLDTDLQREMRDLDANTQQQVNQLDQVLQREMRLLNDTALAERRFMREQLVDLSNRVRDLEKQLEWSE